MLSEKSSFPSAPQAAVLLLVWFLLQFLIGVVLYDSRQSLGITPEQLAVIDMLLANGILISAVMHIRGMSYRDLFHPSKTSPFLTFIFIVPPVLLLIPLLVLLDGLLISGLETVFPVSAWEEQAFVGMAEYSLSIFVATCLIAPVVEEMLFRGILLRSFLEIYPRGMAIGYSALYFGVAHRNIYQFLLAFLLGLLLGYLFERSRSLIPCIAMHAAVNGSIFLWINKNDASAGVSSSGFSTQVWLTALVLAAIGAMVLRRLLARKIEVKKAD